MKRRQREWLARKPRIIVSSAPKELAHYYDKRAVPHNPRPVNKKKKPCRIEKKVKEVLARFDLPPPTLVETKDFPVAIPCTLPDAGKTRPEFWVIAFRANTEGDNRQVLEAWKVVKDSGIKPACRPSGRSKAEDDPFHPGIWLPSTQHDIPFLSVDGRHAELQAFMKVFGKVTKGAPSKLLRVHDLNTQKRMGLASFASPYLANTMDHVPTDDHSTMRLGKLGAALAVNEGQSEGWHFDRNDDDSTYSVVSVFGEGWLVIPQLNMEFELSVGTVLFFQASHLAHYVRPLNKDDKGKRLVVTTFTCAEMNLEPGEIFERAKDEENQSMQHNEPLHLTSLRNHPFHTNQVVSVPDAFIAPTKVPAPAPVVPDGPASATPSSSNSCTLDRRVERRAHLGEGVPGVAGVEDLGAARAWSWMLCSMTVKIPVSSRP
ncbi:hypothetical protein TREMEDRAFT_59932 [Tremella mesenterica DSM 1558]|uniref:uncharacterized protein n=1 Tax=Tremella mesenterica (strain ATCC 24925 / CBS 8224 / DSM 1558 / NBRC 9311 / NRRL Y-6157 / RJB 2259-6 / UBC 559-6) TaxID=578456 RepID=UPI0003F494C7|nr:uncharacterized protein TREMEDRAFT_59932 [Tremella mesenterica DSM 1558]EIW70992.1 hypothetical protein TREMEDRAFT_59932 [Tremella mesenterica DSM 1558]